MDALYSIVLVLGGVAVSALLSRVLGTRVPVPIVQIGVGAALSQHGGLDIALDPEAFLFLFVAPLLFLDGWRIPKQQMLRDRWAIIALAIGLVGVTVLATGYFVSWLVAPIPLAVAFALAAALSPTDAVAVSNVWHGNPVAARLRQVLEAESLLNDAPGLICLRFAITAALGAQLSWLDGLLSLAWLALAGVLAGAAVTLVASAVKDFVSGRFGEEVGTQILVSLLIPFLAYLLATAIGGSGVLGAVSAGIAMSYEERAGRAEGLTRLQRTAVWDLVRFVGNGAIFVLLGHQLPEIALGTMRVASQAGQSALWILLCIAAVVLLIWTLRLAWSLVTLRLVLPATFLAERPGQRVRLAAIASLAGARGAISLSGIMTLPLLLPDGRDFPCRDLVIFLAAGVIVVTLLAASLGIPPLLGGVAEKPGSRSVRLERQARQAAANAAIAAIQTRGCTAPEAHRAGLLERYRHILATIDEDLPDAQRRLWPADRGSGLALAALRAERSELLRIAQHGELPDDLRIRLVREIDLLEAYLLLR